MFPPEYKKLRRLFPRSDKIKIIILFLMMMVAAVLEVAGISMVPAFVAIVANPQRILEFDRLSGVFAALGVHNSRDLLIYGGTALIGVFVVKNTYILFFRYFEAKFIYNRRYTFSHRLMSAYMQAPYTFYLQRNSSELLRNATSEVNIMINNVLSPTLRIAKEIIMGVSVVVFLIVVEPIITLFVTIGMGGMAGLFLLFTKKRMKHYGNEAQHYRREMIKAARHGFGGIKDARVQNREKEFVDVFRQMAYDSSQLQRKKTFISMFPRPVIETIAVGGVMLIALVMVLQGRPIANIVPVLTMFGVAIMRLMPAIQMTTNLITDLRFHLPSVNAIYDDLQELKPFIREFRADRNRKEKFILEKQINIIDLHYRYPNSGEQALNGVSVTISKGQAVAFVGPSGAGKTTIADVLLGLLVPHQGHVLADGKDISKSISAWQQNIGYIPQFIYLSDDSLRRNIAFGLPDHSINDDRIARAVEQAQLKELVDRLPEGLETMIGERGTRLSGGQRQRAGIARALYHDPQVLVMDEATSALDNVTEQQIIDAIDTLKGQRTVIMIAHRLTTVMNCDVLFYMENGRILDQGTYGELLQRNVNFTEMAMESNRINKRF